MNPWWEWAKGALFVLIGMAGALLIFLLPDTFYFARPVAAGFGIVLGGLLYLFFGREKK